MNFKHRSLSIRARIAFTVVASVAGSVLLSGCGIGGSLTSASSSAAPLTSGFGGALNGGPNPIMGATMKLYITGNTDGSNGGYGHGTFVQEANTAPGGTTGQDTGADGSFHFAGGYACPAGQFLYLVSSGGDTGGGVNPKAFLVAALGRCEDLFSAGTYIGHFIYINERTTVAAAYALSGFTTITGQDSSAVVGIGAPATNNASVGCIANGGSCPTTVAAGLRHAFANAANLVNVFDVTPNTAPASNASARLPVQLINSIANTTVACVNSDGTSNSCQTLFAATGTDPDHGNTFQALLNLSKNPTLAGTGVTAATLYAATTPQTNFYRPFLTAAPTDFSISISYPKFLGATAGTQGLTYPFSGTLDINDNYYIGNYDSASQTVSNAASFTSSGALVSFTPDSTTDITATGASVDAAGNLFLVGYTPTTTSPAISKFGIDVNTGSITAPTTFSAGVGRLLAAAVDAHNNLWIGSADPNSQIAEVPAGATSTSFARHTTNGVTAIAVDPNQNIWLTNTNPHTLVGTLGNTGSVAAPTYSTSAYFVAYDGPSPSGISFVAGSPFTGYVSNASPKAGITKVTPTVVGIEVTGLLSAKDATGGFSGPSNNQTDGAGIIWAGDSIDVAKYTPGSTSTITLLPCTVSTVVVNTACTASPYSTVQSVSVDASGSVWFLSSGTGTVNQLIGAATPVWPQLSLGLLGEPQ